MLVTRTASQSRNVQLFNPQRPGTGARVTGMARVSLFQDDALAAHDALSLAHLIRTGELAASEVAQASRNRLRQSQPHLNAVSAWVAPPNDRRFLTARRFSGVPTLMKDDQDVAGLATRVGSRATSLRPVARDGQITRQFRELGFAIAGKTTMPEFGLTATTEPLLYGPTRNPWNPLFATGGSSGGAAALVAAGAVPLAHGNDGGGSLRIPAASCGVIGFRPSNHRMLTTGATARMPVEIIAEGVMTRSLSDLVTFMNLAQQPIAATPGIRPWQYLTSPRLRIAVTTQGHFGRTDPELAAATMSTAATCAELGHEVTEIDFPFSRQFARDFLRYWSALAFTIQINGEMLFGAGFQAAQLEPFTKGMAHYCRQILERLPATIWRLRRFASEYQRFFADFDVLLTPTTGTPAPPLGYLDVTDFETHIKRLFHFAGFTPMQNVAGAPAISLPWSLSSAGLPLGVQLAADLGADNTILALAKQLADAHQLLNGVPPTREQADTALPSDH